MQWDISALARPLANLSRKENWPSLIFRNRRLFCRKSNCHFLLHFWFTRQRILFILFSTNSQVDSTNLKCKCIIISGQRKWKQMSVDLCVFWLVFDKSFLQVSDRSDLLIFPSFLMYSPIYHHQQPLFYPLSMSREKWEHFRIKILATLTA